MKLLDPNDPFFRKPATRWVTVLVPLAMAALEMSMGSPGWAMLFLATGVFAFWVLIVKGPDKGGPGSDGPGTGGPDQG